MVVEPMQRRYTANELLSDARRRGHKVSRRLLTDWVAIGLLDKGTDRGRGRGRGKEYTWPDEQRRLFLVLLDKHGTVKRPVLANIPVALWLFFGDQHAP